MINERYSGIVNNLNDFTFHILGCGAIGSSAAQQLVRMGASNLVLYDNDKVEEPNIGVSQYNMCHIGQLKVNALESILKEIDSSIFIKPMNGLFESLYVLENNIVILGFDSMKSRLDAVTSISKSKDSVLCLIDGRMGAETYQQYNFIKPTLKTYLKKWYSDKDGSDEPCNAKATSYCSNMSGSFITNAVRKFTTRQPLNKELLFHFPSNMLVCK